MEHKQSKLKELSTEMAAFVQRVIDTPDEDFRVEMYGGSLNELSMMETFLSSHYAATASGINAVTQLCQKGEQDAKSSEIQAYFNNAYVVLQKLEDKTLIVREVAANIRKGVML